MTRPTLKRFMGRAPVCAPIIVIALFLILPRVGAQSSATKQLIATRNAQIQAAIDSVPLQFGGWVGKDVAVPQAAKEILHPNAILSRTYRRLGDGFAAQLLVVHCSDARDMGGHYPPNCYPRAGWDQDDRNSDIDATLALESRQVTVQIYHFRRLDKWGSDENRLRVLNYFVLPRGETTVDIAVVRRQADRPSISRLGVAQIQIAMSGNVPEDESLLAGAQLLNGISDLLTVLGQE